MSRKTLHQLYAEHTGKVSDKWSLYLTEYDRLLDDYRDKPIRLLEIGIQNGGSLEIWSNYFNNATALIGCDINPDCGHLSFDDTRIDTIVGDANASDVRERVLQRSPQFDIIIDDGSHRSSDIIKSFALYFPRIVEGGIFIAEDLHCSYWNQFEGGLFDPCSSISFFKHVADVINHEHWGIPKTRAEILRGFFTKYGCDIDEETLSHVHSVEFINSMCVVHKMSTADNGLGHRVIAGSIEPVVAGHLKLNGCPYQIKSFFEQPNNPFSSLNQTVVERDGQIASLNQTVVERDGQIASLNQTVVGRDSVIRDILGSTSWRLTRPLRAVKSFFMSNGDSMNAQENTPKCFDAAWHLKRNLDVVMSGTDAYTHYVQFGKAEGRQPAPEALFVRNGKRVRRLHGALLMAIKRSGDVRRVISKAWAVLNREGWDGVRRSVIWLHSQVLNSVDFDRNDYAEWIHRYDTLTDETRVTMRARIDFFFHKPLISVVMPVYNPPLNMLEDAIRSVQGQLYPYWELCIADDASTDAAVHKLLQCYADIDSRIKVVFRKRNGHISAASNSALDLVKGEYVALLDNDDLLREQALFWVADAIVTNPDAGLIYSDEDKIDQSGRRYDPYFKPDWNPDLFLSHNMICHLGVYRTDLVRQLGGFREGYQGAQDYDLALRCTEQLAHHQIVHIPRVLYHWRSHPGSTAQAGSEKNYALLAGKRALNDHFARAQIAAKAELLDFGMYRACYFIPAPAPLVSLIIPTRNGLDLIKQCIDSILAKTTYKNYEILVVNNNSDDPKTLAYFASLAGDNRIQFLCDEGPFNFSLLNNAAVQQARGEYVGLLNNDTDVISPEWLEEMMGLAIQPGVGAVGARLWYPNDTLQHGGCITGIGGVAGHSHKHLPRGQSGYLSRAQLIQTCSVVTAACLVIKKSIYQEVGGLDETNLKVAFNDVDFCLRIREAGYRNVWTPYAELYHHESATRGYDETPEKKLRFRDEVLYMKKRWGDSLMNDPAYSLNLTLDHEDFSLAWPPRVGLP